MNQEQFKSVLKRDKVFLKELYESNAISKSKRILNFANDSELNTLIKYIHLVCNGEIKIKKTNFDALSTRHLAVIKKHFEKKTVLSNFNQKTRKDKMQILQKLLPVLSHLLTPLFKE